MNERITAPDLPQCWCDPSHGVATFVIDMAAVCGDCAEGVARAIPLGATTRYGKSASPAVTQSPRYTPQPASDAAGPLTSAQDATAGGVDLVERARADRDQRGPGSAAP